eukprot:TRINITY_DN17341_c0_g1_i2.p1 TRINITY_DN17341_c0_g1~~TRINITY_DN17341_c0_g1_i2.p1  ORF type:complete len:260 (-),score=72.28 TRINITY_DN17341_c0_g1_i2:150-863(-)
MLRSLVGSEMCIRDRYHICGHMDGHQLSRPELCDFREWEIDSIMAVCSCSGKVRYDEHVIRNAVLHLATHSPDFQVLLSSAEISLRLVQMPTDETEQPTTNCGWLVCAMRMCWLIKNIQVYRSWGPNVEVFVPHVKERRWGDGARTLPNWFTDCMTHLTKNIFGAKFQKKKKPAADENETTDPDKGPKPILWPIKHHSHRRLSWGFYFFRGRRARVQAARAALDQAGMAWGLSLIHI